MASSRGVFRTKHASEVLDLLQMKSFCYTRKHFCISTSKLKIFLEYSCQHIFGSVISEVYETLIFRLAFKVPMTLIKLIPDIFMPRPCTPRNVMEAS